MGAAEIVDGMGTTPQVSLRRGVFASIRRPGRVASLRAQRASSLGAVHAMREPDDRRIVVTGAGIGRASPRQS